MNNTENSDRHARLIAALRDPGCYPHPVGEVEVLETHISWVLLTGRYAYKIKKPVNLGFLDFSTLAQRDFCCREELRLNRRLAPGLYLDVVGITGSPDHPRVGGDGEAIEYAVKMLQFGQDQLASRLLRSGNLTAQHIEQLAGTIATFHRQAAAAKGGSRFGSPATLKAQVLQNFDQIAALPGAEGERTMLGDLRDWSERELSAGESRFGARQAAGRVREGHGDLHLGNIALVDGEITPFDCIEFSAELRWNDVASETAFLVMDLIDRGRRDFAFLFLSTYLELTGDYDAVAVLRFYLVYRAMVRAKVHCLRAHQAHIDGAERARLLDAFRDYLKLAAGFTRPCRPSLIAMHGMSGSGKTVVSHALVQAAGALRIRSDVERKRLHDMTMLERPASGVAAGIYAGEVTKRVYQHLAQLARKIIAAGYSVILDAAFLRRWQRDLVRDLARELAVPFVIASLQAPETVLQARIVRRSGAGTDASDADLAVLAHQLATGDPIAEDERAGTITLDAALPPDALAATAEWRALLARASS